MPLRAPFVSVPLRGKEGAGHNALVAFCAWAEQNRWVSVPLRGKEGAGPLEARDPELYQQGIEFPSPCGVRRVRDLQFACDYER